LTVTRVATPGSPNAATRTYNVNAETRLTNLARTKRVTVLVDGLTLYPAPASSPQSASYSPTTLFHGRYGPDADGNVDAHAVVQITRGSSKIGVKTATNFTAVAVQAMLSSEHAKQEPIACDNYAEMVSAGGSTQEQARMTFKAGCVIMLLPGPIVSETSPS
jgi:hypothetical protein